MRYVVTGAAGFVGSNLVDRLLAAGHEVVGYDNLSTGRLRFLDGARHSSRFTWVEGDTLDRGGMVRAFEGADTVFHLAANADVRRGLDHPERDLEQNTLATFNVLEAMRSTGVGRLAFASTGSIYGEPDVFPTPEDAPFPVQTSLYGASKLACEGLIGAYVAGFGLRACIFRFVGILGERYSHGHIFDFYRALGQDSRVLQVLGDGHQRKSYLYVQDCLDAMLLALERTPAGLAVFNLGTDEFCEVNDSIRWITEQLGVTPRLAYTGGSRGWVGDSPFIFLDCRRIRELGWQPRLGIREGVQRTVTYLQHNPWLLDPQG